MIDLDQRILDAQAQILELEREQLERTAQELGEQPLPLSDKKAAMKALAQENYQRHRLAASLAVCFSIPAEDAIAIADELRSLHPTQDLAELVRSGGIYPLLRQTRSARVLERISWEQLQEALSEKPGIVGDESCRFNARSPFVRCAVNPSGPCSGCSLYERG